MPLSHKILEAQFLHLFLGVEVRNKLGPFYEWTFLCEIKFTNIIILTLTNIDTNIYQYLVFYSSVKWFLLTQLHSDRSLKVLSRSHISL